MKESPIPLRELKKARSKIALYNAAISLIGDKSFREVLLDDICTMAEVSRVTFFNFFQQKEDLLVYYMRIWLTNRIIEVHTDRIRGFAAVRHLLRHVEEQWRRTPGIMPSLISFLAEKRMHPTMPAMSNAEIRLLFPGHEQLASADPDMYGLFRRSMQEAQQDGVLKQGISVETAVQVLFTVFYGAFLTAQLYADRNVGQVYETHLQLLMDG